MGPATFKALLAQLPVSERLQVGLEIAEIVQSRFAADNASLIERRPELGASDLDPDWRKYDTASNLQRLDEARVFSAETAAAVTFARDSAKD